MSTGKPANRSHDWALLVLSGLVLVAAAILRINTADEVVLPWVDLVAPATCFWREWLSVGCPGCGLTRSFVRMADGQWAAAWQTHAAGPLLCLLIVAQLPYRGWRLARSVPAGAAPTWALAGNLLVYAACSVTLLQWVVRWW